MHPGETESLPPSGAPLIEPGEYNPFFQGFLNCVQGGTWPDKPRALQTLGIMPEHWIRRVGRGRVTYVWPNDGSRDINTGRVFGGWVGALSDHVVSICMMSALDGDEAFTTQDLQIKLFRPVMGDAITIEAEVVNRSRTTGYVEARWLLPNGKLAVKVLAWKAIRSASSLAPRV